MTQYLKRKSGNHGSGWVAASPFHLVREDGTTSKCGGAVAGAQGYVIVEKERPPLQSLTCNNCLDNIIVRS